jgi:hypothetical protein
MHLAELGKPDVLDAMLPGLGRPWSEVLAGTQSQIFYNMPGYVAEWEAVAARWADDDHALLQPTGPCWIMPLVFALVVLKQTVAKKELEL